MEYEKYSIKRLREIVKHHNKNVRIYAKQLKEDTIRENIIKVTDYKTKDSLISKMKKHQKYHMEFMKLDKSSKNQSDFDMLSEKFYSEYSDMIKSGEKEKAKNYLNATTAHLKLILEGQPDIKSEISMG